MKILTEYDAKAWKISKIDPDTSGKYVFDYMEYLQDDIDHCENCGHPIKWCVHIHDAEDDKKTYIVGDDCIEFLLALSGGLENPQDLEKFRGAKKELMRLFNRMRKNGINTSTMDNAIAVVDKSFSANSIKFYNTSSISVRMAPFCTIYSQGITIDDWLHFFPNIKKILLTHEGTFYRSHTPGGEFINANSRLYHKLHDGSESIESEGWVVSDFNADEVSPELGLGTIKVAKVYVKSYSYYAKNGSYGSLESILVLLPNGMQYDLIDAKNGTEFGHKAGIRTAVPVFDKSLTPMFPNECKVDMSMFNTSSESIDPKELVPYYCKDGTKLTADIEKVEAQQREAEERKRKEEEEKARAAEERKAVYDTLITDSKPVLDGMRGHCINDSWLSRIEQPFKKIIGDKIAETAKDNPETCTIEINNCNSTFILRFKDQIDTLKKMSNYSRESYLGNIVRKISMKYNRPTEWKDTIGNLDLSYTFKPSGIKDSQDGEAAVVFGKLTVSVTPKPAPVEPPVAVAENTKITLTIGQLRRLIYC